MQIKQELHNWLVERIPEKRREKRRNLDIVLNFYGFGDFPWPTLEEIAEKFAVGTRERVRQIINTSFRDHVKLAQLPVAMSIFDAIEKHNLVSVSELRTELMDRELVSADTTIRGILNLARDLGRCDGYDIYDSYLNKVKRSEAEFDSNTFLVSNGALPFLKSGLKTAHTLPGLLGLSRFEYLRSELGNNETTERVLSFIRESPDAIKVRKASETWYIYENRDNTLINYCEKIFGLTETVDIDVLSSALQNALRRRSHAYKYPQGEVISEWIEASRWFRVNGKAVEFLGENRALTEIEQAVVDYLHPIEFSLYPPLREHLLAKGFKKPAIDKAVLTSPLVFVDKSAERKTYKYILISKAGAVRAHVLEAPNRYQDFRNRLKLLHATGTDALGESLFRREQSILREWLFGNSVESYCAICGERFSVAALVTAHKKRRSLCSESERVDPYIVFPLCVFGCDYLYESGALKVVKGRVVSGKYRQSDAKDMARVKELCGRDLREEWLRGDLDYFERDVT